jgi:hypothetical protein
VGAGSVEEHAAYASNPALPNLIAAILFLVLFASRDAFGHRLWPTGLRMLALQVHFNATRSRVRLAVSFLRALVFFGLPFLLVTTRVGPWEYFDDLWTLRTNLWSLVFALMLLPLSIVFCGGRGLHDSATMTYVSFREDSKHVSMPSGRSILASLLLIAAISGVTALTFEAVAPKFHEQMTSLVRDTIYRTKGMPGYPDTSSAGVINLAEAKAGFFAEVGTKRLLSPTVMPSLVSELRQRIFEWALVGKLTEEAIELRNGPGIPRNVPYLHAKLWVSRDAFSDHFIAPTITYAAGRSLLEANQQFQVVLVSLVRISRAGPLLLYDRGDLWVIKSLDSENYVVLGPEKDSHTRWFGFRFGADWEVPLVFGA